MSRVADALSRISAAGPARDSFSDDDHPWGDDLAAPVALVDRKRPAPPGAFEPHHAVSPQVAERRSTGDDVAASRMSVHIEPAVHKHLAGLVERVFAPVSGEPARSVAFSGLDTRSSLIAAAAADMLALQTGARVCLVDANFSAPSLHEHFGVENDMGLVDAADLEVSLCDAAREIRPNLWLLPAGSVRRRPSFASEGIRRRVAQFMARFDYVLADIEPVSGLSDGAGLAPLVNGVILVLAADATRRETAKRAADVLRGIGTPVLGAVLTNRQFPIPDALYRRL